MRLHPVFVALVVSSAALAAVGPGQSPDTSERIQQLKATVEEHPDDRGKVVGLANLYFDSKDWSQAERWYLRALELEPEDANVLTDLATAQRELGELLQSLDTLSRALAVDPEHWQAIYNKCILLIYDMNRPAEALPGLETLEAMRDRHPDVPNLDALWAKARGATPAAPAPLTAEHEEAARRYIRKQVSEEYLEEVYQQVAQQTAVAVENQIQPAIGRAVSDIERSRLVLFCYRQIKDLMPYQVLEDLLSPIIAKHLTLEDLGAIDEFLSSPAGQRYVAVQAIVFREGLGAGEELGRRMADTAWGAKFARELKEQFPQWFPDDQ